MMQIKRFMVVGTCIADHYSDNVAIEEEQFDDEKEAFALCNKFNDNENDTSGGFRYFVIDFDPDPFEGGHN